MASPRRRVPDTHRRPARAARVDDSPGWVAGRPGAARPSGRIGAAWTRPPVLVDRELVRPAQPWRPARCQSASVLSGLAAPPRFGRQEDAPFVPAGALPITPRGGARLALQGNNSHRAPSRDCRQDPPRSVTGRRQPGRGDRAPDLWLPPSSAVVTPANRRRASDPSRVRIASDDGTRVMAAIRGGVQHPGRSRGRVTDPDRPHQSARPSKDGGGVGGAGLAHQVKSSPGVGHRPCRGRQDRRGVARSRRSRMCCTTSGLGPNPDMRFGRKPGVRSSGTPGLEPAELAARVRHGATGQQFAWPTLGGWSCNEIRWM